MRFDRFTTSLQTVLADAQSLAVGNDHTAIEPAHVLMTMARNPTASAAPILKQAGGNVQQLIELLDISRSNNKVVFDLPVRLLPFFSRAFRNNELVRCSSD